MKFVFAVLHRLRWIHFPGALLVALLQRTPVLRLAGPAEEVLASSPLGAVLRSAFAGAAALGAVHALAGATTVITNGTNPLNANVGTAIPQVVFAATGGGVGAPGSWQISGQIAPGLTIGGLTAPGVINISNPILTGRPTTAGTFTMQLQAWEGPNRTQSTTPLFSYTVVVTGSTTVAPAIVTQPAGQTVTPGSDATFSVAATGTEPLAYQWQRDGAALAGANGASLTLRNVQSANAGVYTVTVTNSAGSVTSDPVVVGNPAARLTNLSVRTAMAASQTLIVGVVVDGGTRNVLVRAAGPALAAFGIATPMLDPRLDLFNGSTIVFSNDNWDPALASTFASVSAFPFAANSKDAALLQPIDGPRSIQARGTGAGVVLVEAYATGAASAAHLTNVSARNRVGTGDDILIAGFNVDGTGPKPLLIRAIGPKLAAFGVTGTLVDPKLEIYNSAGVKLAENDNWSASLAARFTDVAAFPLDTGSRDAATLLSLAPGTYTVQVRGADGGTGEALIEIYEMP